MIVSVWLLVLFLNGEPVIPTEVMPEELIFRREKDCERIKEYLLDLYDDVRCVQALMREQIKT